MAGVNRKLQSRDAFHCFRFLSDNSTLISGKTRKNSQYSHASRCYICNRVLLNALNKVKRCLLQCWSCSIKIWSWPSNCISRGVKRLQCNHQFLCWRRIQVEHSAEPKVKVSHSVPPRSFTRPNNNLIYKSASKWSTALFLSNKSCICK